MKVAQIRLLRRALIALIIAVMAAVAWNYIQTWRRRARVVQQGAKILGMEVLRSADSIEYSESDHGLLHFKLRARKLLETRQGINLLEGIDAYDYRPDGTPKNHIQSRRAEYDREKRRADFYGDVRIHSGADLELRTDSLHYDLEKNSGSTDDRISLASSQARGSANGAWYDHAQGVIALRSNLDFVIRRKVRDGDGNVRVENMRVRSSRGEYSETAHTIKLEGGVRVDSESASLSGDEVVATFSEDKKRLTSLVCAGNAAYLSREAGEARSLQGDRMTFVINPGSRALEKIDVAGRSRFSLVAPDAEQALSGSELHIGLDPVRGLLTSLDAGGGVTFEIKRDLDRKVVRGKQLAATFVAGSNLLERLLVSGGASMSSGGSSGTPGDDLSAEEIRMTFAESAGRSILRELQAEKSVRLVSAPRPAVAGKPAQSGRTLSASNLQMIYSAAGDFPESGRATGQVTISGIPLGAQSPPEIRSLKADTVRFEFYPRSGQLRSFEGENHVDVLYRKPSSGPDEDSPDEFHTTSSNMRATFNESDGKADSVRQWGGFVYEDGTRSATSDTSDYDALTNILSLRGSPKIVDEQATTTGELVQYDQAQKFLSARGKVRSVLKPRDTGQATPFSPSSNASSPSVVTADFMQVWTEISRVYYSGNVQMLSENSQLSARSLDLSGGGAQVDADGDIRHLLPRREGEASKEKPSAQRVPAAAATRGKNRPDSSPILVRSSHLRYLTEQNSVRYNGNVTLQSEDTWMSSDTLDVTFGDEGKVRQAAAAGKLLIHQAGREIKGQRGDYDLALGQFVVTGNPAEIKDPIKGKSQAPRLTFFTADDRILLGN